MRLLGRHGALDVRFVALDRERDARMPDEPAVQFVNEGSGMAKSDPQSRGASRLPRFLAGTRSALALSLFRRRRECRQVVNMIRAADIAHVHAEFADIGAAVAAESARRAGVPYSVGVHARDVFCCKYPLSRLLRDTTGVMACNDAVRKGLISHCPELESRTQVIHHGLVLNEWPVRDDVQRTEDAGLGVLFVGRLVEKKGVDIMLRGLAAARASGTACRLTVAGTGPLAPLLQALAGELDLGGAVEWLGRVGRERVGDLMTKAHCLAVPSRIAADGDRDGIPNVVVEAMATGLPVIGTTVGGIGEVLDASTGWPIAADSAEALAEALADLANAPEETGVRAESARALVEREFNADNCIEQRVAVFADMLARGGKQ